MKSQSSLNFPFFISSLPSRLMPEPASKMNMCCGSSMDRHEVCLP